jgi:hypothetical protein
MLNDKSRHGLSHLPPRRKWASLEAGTTFRYLESRIANHDRTIIRRKTGRKVRRWKQRNRKPRYV